MNAGVRIKILEQSLRCFRIGWFSLVPLLGLPFFILALRLYQEVRLDSAGSWNAARTYLNWGALLACLGGLQSLMIFGWLFYLVSQLF
jgi:hypothetical protein